MFAIHVVVSSIFYSCGTCHTHTCKVCMYFVIPTAFLVCLCMCSLFSLSLSGFQSWDDRRMGSSETFPQRLIEKQKELSLCFFWIHCVYAQICMCVCVCAVGGGGFVHACVNASACVSRLSPVPCALYKPCLWASLWSGRQEIPTVWNSPNQIYSMKEYALTTVITPIFF